MREPLREILSMSRKVCGLISNDLRSLWFMGPMHARRERRLSMNLERRSPNRRGAIRRRKRADSEIGAPMPGRHGACVPVMQDFELRAIQDFLGQLESVFKWRKENVAFHRALDECEKQIRAP